MIKFICGRHTQTLLWIFIFGLHSVQAQRLSYHGYVKDLRAIDFTNLDSITTQSLIHNRINARYKITDSIGIKVEVRNRLFYGNLPEALQTFEQKLAQQNDFFTMSWSPLARKNLLFNIMVDRVYLEWQKKGFEIRLGRQRINWGVNLFWNPNDIFNIYSIYDFDYQERPGSDALLVRYYTGAASSIEGAIKAADSFDKSTVAGMWKINQWNYDFQFIAGKTKRDAVFGVGWAGNIKNAGFKGECSFFQPYHRKDSLRNGVVASIGSDYSFSEKFYVNTELLFNSYGKNKINLSDFARYTSSTLTAKELSPTRFSFGIQPVYKMNIRYTASISSVWYIGENAFYLSPMLTTQIKENFDLDFIGQMIFSSITGDYKLNSGKVTVRFKWSF